MIFTVFFHHKSTKYQFKWIFLCFIITQKRFILLKWNMLHWIYVYLLSVYKKLLYSHSASWNQNEFRTAGIVCCIVSNSRKCEVTKTQVTWLKTYWIRWTTYTETRNNTKIMYKVEGSQCLYPVWSRPVFICRNIK